MRRDDRGFERRTVRGRRMQAVEPPDGRIEIVEPAVGNLRRDFGPDAIGSEAFVRYQQPTRLRDRF